MPEAPRSSCAAPTARSSASRSSRSNPYACELEDFAAAVAGERAPRYGREDAVAQARAIAALYASAEANEPTEVER